MLKWGWQKALFVAVFVAGMATREVPPLAAADSPTPPRFDKPQIGIVLMHGRLGTPNYLLSLASSLRGEGYLIETPTMTWSRDRAFDTTIEAAMAEIDILADRLKARGAQRIIVAGHSLGGAAALRYGATREDLGGLILLAASWDPASSFWQGIVGESVRRARNVVAAGDGDKADTYQYVTNDGKSAAVLAHAQGYLDFNRPDSPIALAHNAQGFEHAVPALWLSASGDSRTARRVAERAFGSLPSHPLSRYETIGTNHNGIINAATTPISAWLDRVRR